MTKSNFKVINSQIFFFYHAHSSSTEYRFGLLSPHHSHQLDFYQEVYIRIYTIYVYILHLLLYIFRKAVCQLAALTSNNNNNITFISQCFNVKIQMSKPSKFNIVSKIYFKQ